MQLQVQCFHRTHAEAVIPSGTADKGLSTRRSLRHHCDRELGGAVGEKVRCPDVLHNLVMKYMHAHACKYTPQLW